jgi:hypothetical protein
MRYSNIEPLQDSRVGLPTVRVRSRPRLNQCSCGSLPWAIAMKLARRASDARRS